LPPSAARKKESSEDTSRSGKGLLPSALLLRGDFYIALVKTKESDMSEENDPLQYPEWQDTYLETAYSLPYVDTSSQPSYDSQPAQSASQSPQQAAIRTEIDQLAAIHQLGRVQKEYKNEVSRVLASGLSSCIVGVLCFLPFILVVFAHWGYFRVFLWTIIGGFAFLSYGINRINVAINNIGANMLYQNPRGYLCSHGVMFIQGKQVQAIRWDQIRTVQKIFTDTSNVLQQYILSSSGDEEPLVLDRVLPGFKILGVHIEREVNRRLLPKAIAAYKAGQTFNFGAINVTPQGLSLEEVQKELPWEKLGDINEYRGDLIIKEKGTLSTWENIEVSTIFNLYVLLRLIRQIKNDSRMKESEPRSVSYQPPANDPSQRSEWREYE